MKILIFSLVVLITGFSLGIRENKLSQNDIKSAQKMIGLNYTDNEIDTMLTCPERNLEGYD